MPSASASSLSIRGSVDAPLNTYTHCQPHANTFVSFTDTVVAVPVMAQSKSKQTQVVVMAMADEDR